MKALTIVFTALLLLASQSLFAADNLLKASKAACDNVKQCALKEMSSDASVSPQMKQMMIGMMDEACAGLKEQFGSDAFKEEQKIMNAAAACLNAISKASCDKLDDTDSLPACQKFNKMAENYEQ